MGSGPGPLRPHTSFLQGESMGGNGNLVLVGLENFEKS